MSKHQLNRASRLHENGKEKGADKIKSFVGVALKDFGRVGGIFPSSRWTARAVVRQLTSDMNTVIEYGPGDGAVTRHILKLLRPKAKLLGIELNQAFVEALRKIQDKRLEVVAGDVAEMSEKLKELLPDGVDAVVSGIPFTFIPAEQREKIVKNTRDALKPGGRFVLYQNSLLMKSLLNRYFQKVTAQIEPRNIPPYFILVGEA